MWNLWTLLLSGVMMMLAYFMNKIGWESVPGLYLFTGEVREDILWCES